MEIVEEISLIEDIQTTYGPTIREHPADISGKSTGRQTTLVLKSGIAIAVECYYWHNNMYHNNLKVILSTDELNDWLY